MDVLLSCLDKCIIIIIIIIIVIRELPLKVHAVWPFVLDFQGQSFNNYNNNNNNKNINNMHLLRHVNYSRRVQNVKFSDASKTRVENWTERCERGLLHDEASQQRHDAAAAATAL